MCKNLDFSTKFQLKKKSKFIVTRKKCNDKYIIDKKIK